MEQRCDQRHFCRFGDVELSHDEILSMGGTGALTPFYLKKENKMMKHLNKYLSLALALVLCLSLAACGESNEDYGDDGSDYNLYGVPDSLRGW